MGFIPLAKDIQPLVHFVDRILLKYRDISATELKAMNISDIGKDIQEALQITPSIQIPNDYILFGRVIGMLNGLASRLDPDTNIIEIAAPFAKRFIQAEQATPAAVLKQAKMTTRSLIELPKLMTDFLVTTARGETRVEITSHDIVIELRKISRIGRGFIFAILTVGLGVAAVVLRLNHLNMESNWAAVGCGALFIWLLLVLRRS